MVQTDHPEAPPQTNAVDEPMPGMGTLCLASGNVTPPAAGDILRDLLVYNSAVLNPTTPVDQTFMIQNGQPAQATPDGNNPPAQYDWEVTQFATDPATTTANPTPPHANNVLYVLAAWDRDNGDGTVTRIWDPAGLPAARAYIAVQGACRESAAKEPTKKAAKLPKGVCVEKRGSWIVTCGIPAAAVSNGFLLRDERGNPLRATKVAAYAFDVDWRYTYLTPPLVERTVQHAIGDLLVTDPGLHFQSPINSIILWQGHWGSRRHAVIVSEKKSRPDVIDHLENNKNLYLRVNFHQAKPIRVTGTYCVAVKILVP